MHEELEEAPALILTHALRYQARNNSSNQGHSNNVSQSSTAHHSSHNKVNSLHLTTHTHSPSMRHHPHAHLTATALIPLLLPSPLFLLCHRLFPPLLPLPTSLLPLHLIVDRSMAPNDTTATILPLESHLGVHRKPLLVPLREPNL